MIFIMNKYIIQAYGVRSNTCWIFMIVYRLSWQLLGKYIRQGLKEKIIMICDVII